MALTPEQEATALTLASNGWKIKEIYEWLGVDRNSFWKHRRDNPTFDDDFTRARRASLEELADDLLSVADDVADVQRARLKSDNIKWTLAKRMPEIYGDKIDINVNQQVSVTSALTEAKARLLPAEQAAIPQPVDITSKYSLGSADTVSVALPEARDAEVKKQSGNAD